MFTTAGATFFTRGARLGTGCPAARSGNAALPTVKNDRRAAAQTSLIFVLMNQDSSIDQRMQGSTLLLYG
jgi:hypothetical protein